MIQINELYSDITLYNTNKYFYPKLKQTIKKYSTSYADVNLEKIFI